jgi:hypothetical protein
MPVVLASAPVLEAGRSSARRKPVWMLEGEGAEMEESLMVMERDLLA